MEPETKLDEEYKNCLKFLRSYIINTTNPDYVSHCRVWIEKMNACSLNQKDVRNQYMNELCRQIQSGKLAEPFTLPPPPFGDTLVPHIPQTSSWSDLSTISTTTVEIAASGDSQADVPVKKSSEKFMNIYGIKIIEQNDIIEELKHKNFALSEQLNDCSVQLNTQNTDTEMGMNMLRNEVEYLKNRLKELLTIKRNLQDDHNTIVAQWESTAHDMRSKLDEEQHKNNELNATIHELENKLKVFEECDQTTSVGENVQQNLLDLHQAEIAAIEDKHCETLKTLEEKYINMLNNKDKECEEKIKDIKLSYEQKIAEIISDAERNNKLKNDEIMKLEKVVEEQCERMQQEVVIIRSQMEHDTSCNNETLVEKVSFMQECILKMERLLRKYESNYTKKIYALNKELQMKENAVQIQLTTQRAQLLAHANSEKHLEIEAIITQLECRYRTLLEEQQVQHQKMRQKDLDTIKQLTNKLDEKNINI